MAGSSSSTITAIGALVCAAGSAHRMSAAEDHTGAQCDDVEGDDYSTAVALVVTITAMALAVMTARVLPPPPRATPCLHKVLVGL